MKASELRIGNIVGRKMSLDGYVTVPNLGVEAFFTHLRNGAYHPIPLTEEWLVRFGFKGVNQPLYLNNGYFEFVWKNGDLYLDVEGQWISINCKHVHSLQNLYFALTGEELSAT